MTGDELVEAAVLLLVAGYETTVSLIGTGTLALLQHPDQLAILRRQPGLMPQAVEEMLRYDGPLAIGVTRYTTCPVTIAGVRIPAGERVVLGLGAANHDPGRFPQPGALDIARDERSHLAFGHGPHYCLGAPLARLEVQIAFGTLLSRLEDLTLAIPVSSLRWRQTIFRALDELPVSGHPELAVGAGRPADAEIAGTTRLYLCDRPATAGELPAGDAHQLLMARVEELTADAPLIILEGGSVSMLKLMHEDSAWDGFDWSFERIALPPARRYVPDAARRATAMLEPADGRPGLLAELAAAWPDLRSRPTLLSVFTYRIAIEGVWRASLPVEQATQLPRPARVELAQALAAALHAHARWQDRELPDPPVGWRRAEAPAADDPLDRAAARRATPIGGYLG